MSNTFPTSIPSADTVHSRIGPSSAKRWLNCAASVPFIVKLGAAANDDESEQAALGTVAHAVGAECLLTGSDAWEFAGREYAQGEFTFIVDEDMVLSVQTWVDFVRELMKKYEKHGAMLYVEKRVHSDYDEEAFGTSDTIIEVPGLLIIIIDFKNGFVIVEPNDPQLKLYAQYSYEQRSQAMRGDGEPKHGMELYIVQPRAPHPKGPIRKHTTNAVELEDWMMEEVLPKIGDTRNPDACFVVGDWCKYCPGLGLCPATRKTMQELPLETPLDILPDEELGRLRKLKKVNTKFFEALDREALRRVKDEGRSVPGCKLVHKQGDRVFKASMLLKDEETEEEVTVTIEDHLKKVYGDDAYTEPKMKSPAQIEKLPGGKAITAMWAYKPDTGYTLADEDDTREPVVGLMQLLDQATGDTVPV